MSTKRIAEPTIRRLSLYLNYLEDLHKTGRRDTVSSEDLATLVGTTSAQVRKDLSFFGSFGKRGLGYSVQELTTSLQDILGLGQDWSMCIVGAGRIGVALAQFPEFRARGFNIRAVYDSAPEKIGATWDGLTVRDVRHLADDAVKTPYHIGVIAVPAQAAQSVANALVNAGVQAIMNFAPSQITVPPEVLVKTVNMVLEFEGLSFALAQRRSGILLEHNEESSEVARR